MSPERPTCLAGQALLLEPSVHPGLEFFEEGVVQVHHLAAGVRDLALLDLEVGNDLLEALVRHRPRIREGRVGHDALQAPACLRHFFLGQLDTQELPSARTLGGLLGENLSQALFDRALIYRETVGATRFFSPEDLDPTLQQPAKVGEKFPLSQAVVATGPDVVQPHLSDADTVVSSKNPVEPAAGWCFFAHGFHSMHFMMTRWPT